MESRDWKQSSNRAQFAPLLSIAMKAATPEIISNGFRKCGLYPFNVDAIDLTKCMSHDSTHSAIDKPAEISVEHALYFESLMSQRRVKEFRAVDPNEPWTGEESAKELFYVWRKIRNNVQPTDDTVSPGDQAQEHESIPEIEIPGSPANLREQRPSSSREQRTPSPREQRTQSPREQQTPSPISPNLLEGTSLTDFGLGPPNQQQEEKEVTLPSQNNLETTPPKAIATREPQDPKPGPSKMPISPAFSDAILWPTESPIKNNGKKPRLPDAIGAPQWVKYWNERKNEKEEKEKKRLARAEKKMLKDKEKKEQPKRKRIEKNVLMESDSDDDIPLHSYVKSTSLQNNLEVESYVIVKYEGKYFPGQVKNIDISNAEVTTMVLSSATTFKWPEKEATIWYDRDSIVEIIEAPIPINTRGSYKVEEMAKFLQWI